MSLKTAPWDAAEILQSSEDIVSYLEAAFEDGDMVVIRRALSAVARAHGMTTLAASTGIGRETLYNALGENGNPTLDTLLKIIKALGVKLSVAA